MTNSVPWFRLISRPRRSASALVSAWTLTLRAPGRVTSHPPFGLWTRLCWFAFPFMIPFPFQAVCFLKRFVAFRHPLGSTSGTIAERGGENKGAGDDLTMVLQSGTEGPVLQAFSRIFPEIVTELQEDPSLRRRGGGREHSRPGCRIRPGRRCRRLVESAGPETFHEVAPRVIGRSAWRGQHPATKGLRNRT